MDNFTFGIAPKIIEAAPIVCEGYNLSPAQAFTLVLFAALGVAAIVSMIVDFFMRRRQGK